MKIDVGDIKEKLDEIDKAYNKIVSFVAEQNSKINEEYDKCVIIKKELSSIDERKNNIEKVQNEIRRNVLIGKLVPEPELKKIEHKLTKKEIVDRAVRIERILKELKEAKKKKKRFKIFRWKR